MYTMTQPDAWLHERFEEMLDSRTWADGSPVPDEPLPDDEGDEPDEEME